MERGVEERGWRKGPWTSEEDILLADYVSLHGEGKWSSVSKSSGLNRNGKSCRLRWVNYLRPGLKRSHLTPQEQGIIIELHALWGNKWSTIARYLPGRTDNEIKNYWRTHFKKKGNPTSLKQEKRGIQCLEDQEIKLQSQKNDMINNVLPNTNLVGGENSKEEKSQANQEMSLEYPSADGLYTPMMCHDHVAPWPSTIPLDEFDLWGGLWNLDTPRTHGKIDSEVTNVAVQDQVNAHSSNKFSSWDNKEYIC